MPKCRYFIKFTCKRTLRQVFYLSVWPSSPSMTPYSPAPYTVYLLRNFVIRNFVIRNLVPAPPQCHACHVQHLRRYTSGRIFIKSTASFGRFRKWLPVVISALALDATYSYVELRTLTNVTVPVIGTLALDGTDIELRPLTNVTVPALLVGE
jgi:hypothetical protein